MTLRYFVPAEFACRHCGANHMDPVFLAMVDELRARYGKPIIVTSGYRCPEYNARISATGRTGPHTTGHAIDVSVSRGDAFALLRLALSMGFTGIGIKQTGAQRFLHLDDLPNAPGQPRPTIWSYGT
jgi:uncharacterized protein YcbK (DUF882 family)